MRILKLTLSFILVFSMLFLSIACDTGFDDTTDTSQATNGTTEVNEESSEEESSQKAPDTSETTKVPSKTEEKPKSENSIKILAIGNSFSDDAMAYLWNLLRDIGYTDVTVANLYIGGCTLKTHYNNMNGNLAKYTYKKNSTGSFSNRTESTMRYGLNDEEWDYITLQQASGSSGQSSTYSYVNDILDTVEASNPQAKIYWHMTWAYQSDYDSNAFINNYGQNQMTMYSAIIDAVNTKIKTNSRFDGIIPSGTTIQNMRTSHLGDTLTRDGYHMSYNYGRYAVGLTWIATLIGETALDKVDWTPTNYPEVIPSVPLIKESIRNAIKTPFSVTNSTYTSALTDSNIFASLNLDISNYTALLTKNDWNKHAYYNTTSATKWNILCTAENTTSDNIPKYASTKILTKEDLPVGSVIILDAGYTYRPEGWVSLTDKSLNPTTRQSEVSQNCIIVTEEWWSNYNHRGFNLKHGNASYESDAEFEELISHLRIYIPKNQ